MNRALLACLLKPSFRYSCCPKDYTLAHSMWGHGDILKDNSTKLLLSLLVLHGGTTVRHFHKCRFTSPNSLTICPDAQQHLYTFIQYFLSYPISASPTSPSLAHLQILQILIGPSASSRMTVKKNKNRRMNSEMPPPLKGSSLCRMVIVMQ